jgi:hypothetical protein
LRIAASIVGRLGPGGAIVGVEIRRIECVPTMSCGCGWRRRKSTDACVQGASIEGPGTGLLCMHDDRIGGTVTVGLARIR